MAQYAWKAQINDFANIMKHEAKSVEPHRPTAQEMHLRMKSEPEIKTAPLENAPDLLLETLHGLPKPQRQFLAGEKSLQEAMPDEVKARKKPRPPGMNMTWTFPVAKPAAQEPTSPKPVLDAKEFDHIRNFRHNEKLDAQSGSASTPSTAPGTPKMTPSGSTGSLNDKAPESPSTSLSRSSSYVNLPRTDSRDHMPDMDGSFIVIPDL